ncbi:transcriptional regulator [Kushneria pakistanensis]|uniref:Transcriptional regulator n=1 Tax=Kushneria pakistanensis TaxID=1508770 RepID=A0ABQ3F995_9GAMM|nr:LysR family transcriptional regulator [Kushneria pakistanensis]GHC14501.1 transcriptional regulator [Kushneria pakistanensis]
MKLRHIEIFHALISCGSVSAAARHLNVSQPSVTRTLAHAESVLGVSLFKRHPRGLTPTPEALRLWPAIETAVRQLNVVEQLGRQLRHGIDQTLRLGASHALGHLIMPKALITLQKTLPALEIELVTSHFSTLCEELLAHHLDLALTFAQPAPEGIQCEHLMQAPMKALLPSGMVAPCPVTLEWLNAHGLILMPGDDPLGTLLDNALSEARLIPATRLRIKTYSVIAEMVMAGGGTGIVDPFTAERYRDRLQVLPLAPALNMDVALLSASHVPLPHSAHRLRTLIIEQLNGVTSD